MDIKDKIKKILDENHKTWKDAALLLDCNYNLLHDKFRAKRIRYSEIEKIVDSLGYEIVLRKKRDK